MRTLLEDAADFGLPTKDLVELVQANLTGNVLESVMRMRALTELSSQMDSQTLIGLAALASQRRDAVSDMVSALSRQRH